MAVQLFLRFPDQDDEILNFVDEWKIAERLIHTAITVSDDIHRNREQAVLCYDSRNITVFLEKIAALYEPAYLLTPRHILQQKLHLIAENWRDKRLHIPACNYVLWNFSTFSISQVVDTTFAEIAERMLTYPTHQFLLLNLTANPINRKCLPVFKDVLNDDSFPRFAHIHVVSDYDDWLLWWNFYREKTGLTQFTLLDKGRFRKISLIEQGKSAYQEIETGDIWYLDNLHKNEYEVFDKRGHHLGVADLNGKIDETQQVKGRTIDVN